jgi:hypothetical protein
MLQLGVLDDRHLRGCGFVSYDIVLYPPTTEQHDRGSHDLCSSYNSLLLSGSRFQSNWLKPSCLVRVCSEFILHGHQNKNDGACKTLVSSPATVSRYESRKSKVLL